MVAPWTVSLRCGFYEYALYAGCITVCQPDGRDASGLLSLGLLVRPDIVTNKQINGGSKRTFATRARFSAPGRASMESKNEAEKWAAKYQISQFIYDETEEGFAPEAVLIWDKKKVWTLWDESGEIGAFAQPGLEETGIFATDYFVVGWFLGLRKAQIKLTKYRSLSAKLASRAVRMDAGSVVTWAG